MRIIKYTVTNGLRSIFNKTKRIDEKTRKKYSFTCLLLMFIHMCFFTSWEKYGIDYGYAKLLIINAFLFLVAIVFSINGEIKELKVNKSFVILWISCGIIIIITGIHHNITQALLFFGFTWITLFPAFYIIWDSVEHVRSFYLISSEAMVTSVSLFYIANFMFEPLKAGASYYGVAVNPNSVGLVCVGGIITSLYLIRESENKFFRVLSFICFPISIGMMILSASRASILASLFAIISYVTCLARMKNKKLIKQLIVLLIISCACIYACKYFLLTVTPHLEASIKGVKSNPVQNITDSEEENELHVIEKIKDGDTIETASSGRIYIWREYLKRLNLLGHTRDEKGLYIPEMQGKYSAHNTYLEIGYRCGTITGILYAAIAIYTAIYAFRFLFGNKFIPGFSIVPMSIMAFGVLSNLERAIYPFEKLHIFLFFIALVPIFALNEKKEN